MSVRVGDTVSVCVTWLVQRVLGKMSGKAKPCSIQMQMIMFSAASRARKHRAAFSQVGFPTPQLPRGGGWSCGMDDRGRQREGQEGLWSQQKKPYGPLKGNKLSRRFWIPGSLGRREFQGGGGSHWQETLQRSGGSAQESCLLGLAGGQGEVPEPGTVGPGLGGCMPQAVRKWMLC